jgi:glutamine synthetase
MNNFQESAYATALLRSLEFQGVQFLRFVTVDACNNIRCKVRPIAHLLKQKTLENQVSVAAVCYAGLPYYADLMIAGTGMDARNVLILQPDLNSFRNLPYAPKTAMVMANVKDQYTNEPSPLCPRSLLQTVLQTAAEKYNIGFVSGNVLKYFFAFWCSSRTIFRSSFDISPSGSNWNFVWSTPERKNSSTIPSLPIPIPSTIKKRF